MMRGIFKSACRCSQRWSSSFSLPAREANTLKRKLQQALPENVNYAVKSSFLLSFLESARSSAKLKEANTQERKFEDVVKSAEQAAVLVLVY